MREFDFGQSDADADFGQAERTVAVVDAGYRLLHVERAGDGPQDVILAGHWRSNGGRDVRGNRTASVCEYAGLRRWSQSNEPVDDAFTSCRPGMVRPIREFATR